MGRWTWACASKVGTSHLKTGQRLQDAYSCFSIKREAGDIFVGIVSDGAGSAAFGGEGAALVCRSIGTSARQHFAGSFKLPDEACVGHWVDAARDLIYEAAQRRSKTPRDFSCTLVCVISDGDTSVVIHVGDGCAVARDRTTSEWFAPTWPDHGEYASTTTFVTDQPNAKVRAGVVRRSVDALAIFSDGIERMVLDMAAKQPSAKFFEAMTRPVAASATLAGKDARLSDHLQDYLGSDLVNDRTDDDKTLVLATLR